MTAAPLLRIGCVAHGITHRAGELPSLDQRFAMVREAGVFDYVDRSPPDDEFRDTWRAAERHGLPVLAGSGTYTAGRDEAAFEAHIVKARLLGSVVHNVQLRAAHADGHALSDDEVAALCLRAHAFGQRHGVLPCFEVHVNMWSEHPGRVASVANRLAAQGVAIGLTLDPSHLVFKLGNPAELALLGLQADIDAGRIELDPARPGHVMQGWIEAGWVRHAHARAAVPGNPPNTRARHPDGRVGRGIQYPLVRPRPGEYVTDDWDEARLGPWKSAMRQLLQHHAARGQGRTLHVSCEYIPGIDYGAGHGYSLFEQNVAMARWLRSEWGPIASCGTTPDPGR